MFDTHKNFAIGTVLTAPADASGQVFILMPGDGQFFAPNMPVTLCPPNVQPTADNSEIGYLTNKVGDTLTITRAREGSIPMQVASGWQIFGSVTAKSLVDIETAVNGKQATGDYATNTTVTNGLAGKANTTHTHAQADITNLTTDLAAKQAALSLTTTGTSGAATLVGATLNIPQYAGGGGATNLTTTAGPTTITVNSDTGTDAIIAAADTTNAGVFLPAEKTKLTGIATGATANDTDTNLKARANHTGTQTSTTISDFSTAADARITAATGVSIASLSGGKVPTSQLPAVSLVTVQTAATQVAHLALTTQEGDVVVRTDENKTYMRNAGGAGTMADFTLLNTPTDAVTSVNSQTGAVVLGKADVGLSNVDNTSNATERAATATLANKSISGATNTLSAIPQSAVTSLTTDLAGKAAASHSHAQTDISNLTADLAAKQAASVIAANGVGYVNHGATASTARPTGFASIIWRGTVAPTNATAEDTWVDVT